MLSTAGSTIPQALARHDKDAWPDNIFVERLWRTVKDQKVYLQAYDGVPDVRHSIRRYLRFYNRRRLRLILYWRTLDRAYFENESVRSEVSAEGDRCLNTLRSEPRDVTLMIH